MTNRATKYSFVVTSVIHKQYNIYIISTYLRRMTYTKSNKFEKQIHILIEMFVSLVLTDIFLKKYKFVEITYLIFTESETITV